MHIRHLNDIFLRAILTTIAHPSRPFPPFVPEPTKIKTIKFPIFHSRANFVHTHTHTYIRIPNPRISAKIKIGILVIKITKAKTTVIARRYIRLQG